MTQQTDRSWFDIAVTRSGQVWIIDYSPGWSNHAIHDQFDATFTNAAPDGLAPGAYRWSGFTLGQWEDGTDDLIHIIGGTFTPKIDGVDSAADVWIPKPTEVSSDMKVYIRSDILSRVVSCAILGVEHAWESVAQDQFNALVQNARRRLRNEITYEDILSEAKERRNLVHGCLDCNADEDRMWDFIVEFIEDMPNRVKVT